jgi:tetratricopeptide (TPR) repeat protein
MLAHALHAGFIGLSRVGTPEALLEARRLLTRLRVNYPDHSLTRRALFAHARATLAAGSVDQAFGMLDSLRQTAEIGDLAGRSAFLQAEAAYARGDREKAATLFEEAAGSLAGDNSRAARLNATVIQLANGSPETTTVAQQDLPEDKTLAADLKLERALSEANPITKRAAIEQFLTDHPEHPRVAEARLAAAESALAGANPDLSFARAQLDTLAADPEKAADLNPVMVALTRLRIEDLAGDSAAAIDTARALLEQYPDDPSAAETALILGRNLFQASNYNDARLVLEKLAAADSDPGRAQAAWLLAARSAALVPTSQSQSEALILFDKVIDADGSLAPVAKLEKGRLMIDMNRLEEATAFLRKWFESIPPDDPLHIPTGLLLGEAIYAQGSMRPDSLTEALAVYDKLLEQVKKHPALFNRLQYLRGRTLEQIPDTKNPSLKREKQAFTAYYSVLESTTPPPEWHYFELCGFRALALLEKSARWPAAIACAKRIASFNGPRAKEAADRAAQLQLKHMIWED